MVPAAMLQVEPLLVAVYVFPSTVTSTPASESSIVPVRAGLVSFVNSVSTVTKGGVTSSGISDSIHSEPVTKSKLVNTPSLALNDESAATIPPPASKE